MNRLQFAHLPLRTKLIAASALTASIALLIAALTQGISSYLFSHTEAYEHLHAVARVIAGRSTAAIQSQDFGQAGSAGQRAARRAQRRRSAADRLAEARAHALRRQQDAADDEQAGRAHANPEMAAGSDPGQHPPASLRWPDRTAPGLSHHRPGQAHRPSVRARESLGAAGSDAGAARHPARQLGGRARHRLSTGAARAAPDRRAAAQPGRHHAGRGARRLFAARAGHVRRRNRHADARFQRHAGQDRVPRAGAGAPAGTARRRGGRAHQEPRRSQHDAAPGHERQRRGLPHRRGREQARRANSSRACRTKSARR